MANQIIIDIGAVANDGTGDPLRTAFNYVNDNFSNVWNTGLPSSNVQFSGNRILTVNTNGNLILAPNGIGKVVSNVDIIPVANRVQSLGSPTLRWNTVYTQYANIVTANISSATINDVNLGNVGTLEIDVDNLHVTGGTNGYVLQTDGEGNLTWTAQTGGGGNGVPGGANTQVQFNDAGAFGGHSGFTFNKITDTLATPGNIITSGNITGGNVITGGIVSATGNIAGNCFLGNGSQLTGVAAGSNTQIQFNSNGAFGADPYLAWYSDSRTLSTSNIQASSSIEVIGQVYQGGSTGYANLLTLNGGRYGCATGGGSLVFSTSNSEGDAARITSTDYLGTQVNGLEIVGQSLSINTTDNADQYIWTFGNDGNLTAPGSIIVNGKQGFWAYSNIGLTVTANINHDVNGVSMEEGGDTYMYANANVIIVSDDTNNEFTWNFDNTGNLNLPGAATIQNQGGTLKFYPERGYPDYALESFISFDNDIHLQSANIDKGMAIGRSYGSGAHMRLVGNVPFNAGDYAGDIVISAQNYVGGNQKEWHFSTDGNLTVPGPIRSIGETAYRGFYASVNQISGDDPSINQIILSTSSAMAGNNSSDNTNDDVFAVEGLSGSSTVATINLYGSSDTDPIPLADIHSFVQTYIDQVLYNGSALRDNIPEIQTAFDTAQTDLINSMPAGTLRTNVNFRGIQAIFDTSAFATSGEGTGAAFFYDSDSAATGSDLNYANGGTWNSNQVLVGGTGYQVNDTITVPGNILGGDIVGGDMTITVLAVDGAGAITDFDQTGTMSAANYANCYIKYYLYDGTADIYDTGNYLGTNRTACTFTATSNADGELVVSDVASGSLEIYSTFYQDGNWVMVLWQKDGLVGGGPGTYICRSLSSNLAEATYTANGIAYGIGSNLGGTEQWGSGAYWGSMVNNSVGIFSMVAVGCDVTSFSYLGETGSDGDGTKTLTAQMPLGPAEDLVLESGYSTWTFAETGNLTLPEGSIIREGAVGNVLGNAVIVDTNVSSTNIYATNSLLATQLKTNLTEFNWSAPISDITLGTTTTVILSQNAFGDPYRGAVTITGVLGTTEINGNWWYEAADSNQFVLYSDSSFNTLVDSSTWTAYTSGGTAYTQDYANIVINGQNVTIRSDGGDFNNRAWSFNATGETVFPTLATARGDNTGGNINGFTMRMGDGSAEAIITTPDGTTANGADSQRLVINPGKGQDGTSGEGGDIYLWAGRGGSGDGTTGGGSGGDIKIRGGQGMASNAGGYIRIEAGDTNGDDGSAGYIEITGGTTTGGTPGYITITGGTNNSGPGGNININGGYGSGAGGNVVINGGNGGNASGNIYLNDKTFLPVNFTGPGPGEAAWVNGTRTNIGGFDKATVAAYEISAAEAPTLCYSASSDEVQSVKLTFAVQTTSATSNWEQFDVAIVNMDGSNVATVVSNRVRANPAIDWTAVSANINAGVMQVYLTLPTGQSLAYVNYQATEFNLMIAP